MVDIENHEEPLRELSKTSIVNNVTVMLCWSATEAGRYLEQFKVFEHAAPTSIRAHQSGSYSEQMVDFITAPRSINKTDAVGLVSNFGSIRTAINATPEEIALIAGWGDKKVQRWHSAVRQPFRVNKAARRVLGHVDTQATLARHEPVARGGDQAPSETVAPARDAIQPSIDEAVPAIIELQTTPPFARDEPDGDNRSDAHPAEFNTSLSTKDDQDALRQVDKREMTAKQNSSATSQTVRRKPAEENLSEGVMAALSKLRNQ